MVLASLEQIEVLLNFAWYAITFIAAFFVIGRCNADATDDNLSIIIEKLEEIKKHLASNEQNNRDSNDHT